MVGMLAPEFEEVVTGEAEVREIFRVPRVGAIAGCYVRSGADHPRLEGSLPARRHDHLEGRDHVAQAVQGRRPRGPRGLRVRHRPVSDFQDLKPGDIIETFEEREIARV